MAKSFKGYNIELSVPATVNSGKCLMVELDKYVDTNKAVDLCYLTKLFHLSNMGTIAFGYDFVDWKTNINPSTPHPVQESFETMLFELARRAFSLNPMTKHCQWFPNAENRLWAKTSRQIQNEVDYAIQSRIKQMKAGTAIANDFLQNLMNINTEE